MDYDIVIATRNRPDVLGLSIPTYLGQARRPSAIIVVDSSDDHEPVRAMVDKATADSHGVRIECHHAAPGLTAQRNVGLARVESPIVMYPDDDSLWYDGAAEAVMRVYEHDSQINPESPVVGGVTLREVRTPPPGVLDDDPAAEDRRSFSEKLVYRLSPIRAAIEDTITPNPMHIRGDELLAGFTPPPGLDKINASPVPYMLGFRMTYRTEVIRRVGGFDETLHAYGLYEDHEASLRTAHDSMLVMANDAQVYHHRAPGARAPGRRTGVMLLLNMAYVTCRNSDPGSKPRRAIRTYAKVRYLQYLPRSRGGFGKERLDGLKRAISRLDALLEAPREDQPKLYTEAMAWCMSDED